jgi:hypothetical protein
VAAAATACCAGVVVVRDAVVQVFKPSQNVMDFQIQEPFITRSTGRAREDDDSWRCEVAVNGGVP